MGCIDVDQIDRLYDKLSFDKEDGLWSKYQIMSGSKL